MKKLSFLLFIIAISFKVYSQEPIVSTSTLPCEQFNDNTGADAYWDYFLRNWKTRRCEVQSSIGSPWITYSDWLGPVNALEYNNIDGTAFAIIYDHSGPSYFYNDNNYNNLGFNYLGHCLCFDYAVFEDAEVGSKLIHPRIYVTDGIHTIYFESYNTVDDINDQFIRTCAPIELITPSSLTLPRNADGEWHLEAGTTIADFNNVLMYNTEIYFFIDYDDNIKEVVGIDNVCLKNCNCNIDNNFDLKIHTNTDPTFGTPTLGGGPLIPVLPINQIQIMPNHFDPTITYTYDWGDGSRTIGSLSSASHSYTTFGTYVVSVSKTDALGNFPCGTVRSQICIPAPVAYATTTGGTNPPHTIICDINFDYKYHFNTDPTFPTILPNNFVQISINKFHPSSTYEYNWGDGSPVLTGPIANANHIYSYTSGSFNMCIQENNGNVDQNCTAKTCISTCQSIAWAEGNQKRAMNPEIAMDNIKNEITISPNPTQLNAELKISMTAKDNVKVAVIDMTGKKVLDIFNGHLEEGVQKLNINTENVASGIYEVKVMVGNKVSSHRLSVVK